MTAPGPGSVAEYAEVAVLMEEMHWIPGPSAEAACGTMDRMVMGTDNPARVTCPPCKAQLDAK